MKKAKIAQLGIVSLAALVAASPLLSGSALAQQAAPADRAAEDDADGLREIVVTAEKFAEPLQKASTSMLVFNGDNILRQALPNVDQVLTGQTGIQTQPGPRGTNFTVRGFDGGAGVTGSSDVAATGGLAIVIDGVYQVRSENLRSGLLDVGQVEVLKGPQSTTVGGSSLIGAINITERQPEFNWGGSGSFGTGNFGLFTGTAVLNAPLSSNLALRIAGQFTRRNGFVSSNAGDLDSNTQRIKLRWQASDWLNIVLGYERAYNGGNGEFTGNLLYKGSWKPATAANTTVLTPANTNTAYLNCSLPNLGINQATGLSTVTYATLGCPPKYVWSYNANDPTYRERANPWDDGLPADGWPNDPRSITVAHTYSARIEANLGLADLTILPSHQKVTLDQEQAAQATRIPLSLSTQKTDQVEIRLASHNPDKFRWLLGGFYLYTNAPFYGGNETYPGYRAFNGFPLCPATSTTTCTSWSYSRVVSQRTYSTFANGQLELVKGLRALGGVRWEWDEKRLVSSGNNPISGGDRTGPTGITFADLVNVRAVWEDVSYRAGLEYDLADRVMVYGAYGTGYQPGFITANSQNSPITKKQRVRTFTLGLKSEWFNRQVRLNVEAFSSRYTDYLLSNTNVAYGYVTTNPSSSFIGCSVNGGRGALASLTTTGGVTTLCATDTPNADLLTSKGVDIDLTWNATADDRFDISAEYLTTKIRGVSSNITTAAIQASVPAATAAQVLAAYNGIVAFEQSGLSGQTLQNSPSWTINVSYQHRFTLPGGSTLTPRVNWQHKTSYYTSGYGSGLGFQSAKDPSVQPTYNLFNANLNWASENGRYTIGAFIRNIGNYAVLLNYVTGPRPYSAVTLGEPRTWGLTGTVRF